MTVLPQRNAKLTAIKAQAKQATYGSPATQGADKWTGEVGAYIQERIVTNIANDIQNRTKRTTIWIPGDLRPPLTIEPGDRVVGEFDGVAFNVEILNVTAPKGPVGTPRYCKLELRDLNA